jgi:photosystem II stability/assembly factor-like uncharacterized protein
MKHLLLFIKLVLFSSMFLFSQEWKMQHPSGISGVRDLCFINDSMGWAVGNLGMVLKTSDGGINWVKQIIDSKQNLYGTFFIDEKTGWIAGSNVLYRTIDGGENWSKTIEAASFQKVHFFNKDTGIIRTANSIYITHDGGVSFINQTVVITEKENYIMNMSFPDQKHGWLAVLSNYPDKGKIYHTADSGRTWSVQKSFLDDWVTSVAFTDSLKGWLTQISPSPGKNKRKIHHTRDGGKTWLPQPDDSTLLYYCDLEDVYMIDSLNGWAVGTCGYSTNDGGKTWNQWYIPGEHGCSNVRFTSIDKGWTVATDRLNFSTNSGITWNTYPYMKNINDVFFADDIHGYALGENGYILKTDNGGENWKYIKPFDDTIRLDKIIVSKNHEILISATNTGTNEGILFLSADSVKSFSVVKIFKAPIISLVEFGENIYVLSDLLYEINRNNHQIESKQLPIKATYTDMFLVGKDSIWLTGYTGNPIISKPEYKVNSFLYTSVDNGNNWIKNNY